MTPIRYIGTHKTLIFAVDGAGMVNHICVAFTEEQADWLGWSLARAHDVEHRKVDGLPATFIRESEL